MSKSKRKNLGGGHTPGAYNTLFRANMKKAARKALKRLECPKCYNFKEANSDFCKEHAPEPEIIDYGTSWSNGLPLKSA